MTYIIAEVGVNHQGVPSIARNYIEALHDVGADAVKFQMFKADELEPPGERRGMLKNLEFGIGVMMDLKAVCEAIGIDFLCTPFDQQSLLWLAGMGPTPMQYMKLGSGAIHNGSLISSASKCGIPLIVSTGTLNYQEINTLVKKTEASVVMHCISAYPTQPEDMHLGTIPWLVRKYNKRAIGLSDHSLSTVIPAAAVAMGATFIEKHVTFDRSWPSPDHHMSLDMGEFSEMIDGIRDVEKAISGDIPVYERPACEDETKAIIEERNKHMKSMA
jgi:sialic acid synthase SpsE